LVTDQLAAAVGEDRRPIDKACPLLLAAVSREPSDAAAVCGHAAENRGATVAGAIRRVQSGADLDNDAGAQEEVSAEPFGERPAPGVAFQSDAKPAPPGAAGNTGDQYRLNILQREIVPPIQGLESDSQNGNPTLALKEIRTRGRFASARKRRSIRPSPSCIPTICTRPSSGWARRRTTTRSSSMTIEPEAGSRAWLG
jgi:hypothetical protein